MQDTLASIRPYGSHKGGPSYLCYRSLKRGIYISIYIKSVYIKYRGTVGGYEKTPNGEIRTSCEDKSQGRVARTSCEESVNLLAFLSQRTLA